MNYVVNWGWGADKEFLTFDAALEKVKELLASGQVAGCISVYGPDYDCDCDGGGYFMCNDGLTEEQREAVEEVLYS